MLKKRVLPFLMSVVLVVTMLIPIMSTTVSAASGVQEKIDAIKAVYPTGSYFTSTGQAHKAGGSDCPAVCMICSINGIPARGGLPSGASMGYPNRYQCMAFATYAGTYIFGSDFNNWDTVSVSNASLGDIVVFDWDGNGSQDHYAVFLYNSGSKAVVYDANWDYYCGVRYGSEYSRSSVIKVYHAPNYDTINHTHSYTSSVTQSPTCTATGIRTYTCSCGNSYTETIAATGHAWNSGEVISAAGCTSDGIRKYACTACGETYTSAISSTGHTSATDAAVAATCLTDGLTEGSHCSVCGAIIKAQEKVPALGHAYTLTEAAAACESVEATYTCSRCGDSYEETVYGEVLSDWSEVKPENVADENMESKTQYRSSEKLTTQSSSASMDGWTQYDAQITDWTDWSTWQNSAISSSSSREVKTQYINPTYKTLWHYSRSVSSDGKLSTYNTSYYSNSQAITLDYSLTAMGTVDGHTRYGSYDGGYGTYLQNYWYNEWSESVVDQAGYTQYSYRDAIYTYYFYQWGEFSDWQDEEISADDETNVETRVLYRYTIAPNGHDLQENWSYDSETHWLGCDNCTVKSSISSHQYDNDQDSDCNTCGYIREVKTPILENDPQIVVESKKALVDKEFTVSVNIRNNPGFTYLELTPTYSSELSLVSVENGELISDYTQGRQYIWVADNDVYDDGLLMTFTFTTAENVEPGGYEVGFIVRGCVNYDEQNVEISVVNGAIEIVDFTYGDANGDGVINGQDIVRIKKYLANFDYDTEASTVGINAGADANGDGVISGQDVVRLKKYLANYDYETDTSTIVLGPQK